tara:strand:- start:1544 stop:2272 length:729 start_codon:yes stop_codon:yes gene_type:complete
MKYKITIFIFLINIISFDDIYASSTSGKEIKELAREWLQSRNIGENISLLSEIKYPNCDKVEFTNISNNYSLIKAQCFSPNNWSLILRNKINNNKIVKFEKKDTSRNSLKSTYKEIEIYVLNKQLEKNQTIKNLDVTKKKIRKTFKIEGLITNKEDLLGKITKVRIKENRPIYHRNLKKKWLIEKNSKVIVENNSGPITIKVDGIAMENGDYSDKIKVKNLRSNEILVGFVENKKKITINPK